MPLAKNSGIGTLTCFHIYLFSKQIVLQHVRGMPDTTVSGVSRATFKCKQFCVDRLFYLNLHVIEASVTWNVNGHM